MPLKVLVVDDSALMRKHLASLLKGEGFDVQIARSGREALEELSLFEPDVVTLDINMPEMDGLTALSHIMTERPTPTVMVSSLTEKGTLATLEALALGAVDYIAKPGGTISLSIDNIADDLIQKVKVAAKARVKVSPILRETRVRQPKTLTPVAKLTVRDEQVRPKAPPATGNPFGLILIGVSTGGPRTLEEILPALPGHLPWPVLVAQHMPGAFTASLAQRLNTICALDVKECSGLEELQPGKIYIARGGSDLVVGRRGNRLVATNKPESARYTWHPSIELLVSSAMESVPPQDLLAVQLTGMGHDGADAMTQLKKAGGRTIAESEETAVVFGMPAELIKRGGASIVLPSFKIADQIRNWARKSH